MPPSGSTFTDWQQDDNERRLLMDEEFSWSEPPARARRSTSQDPARQRRSRTAVLDRDPWADEAADRAERESSRRDHDRSDYDRADHSPEDYDRGGHRQDEFGSDATLRASMDTTDSDFEAARQRWSDAYSETVDKVAEIAVPEEQYEFDRDDVASYANARVVEDRSGGFDLSDAGRRTVIITGRGDHRYIPESRRRPGSELRFHERSSFNPDRAALWAVLLGVMLLIGCVAH